DERAEFSIIDGSRTKHFRDDERRNKGLVCGLWASIQFPGRSAGDLDQRPRPPERGNRINPCRRERSAAAGRERGVDYATVRGPDRNGGPALCLAAPDPLH